MKKALSILLLLSLLLVLKSFAQEKHKMFAVDSLFMADLTEHFRGVGESSEKEARECLSSLSYQWTANLLLPSEKKQVQTVCLALQDLKLSVDPYFVSYLQAISMMVKRNYDEKSFLDFDHSVSFCLAGKAPSRTVISYLNQVNLLLHDNAFLKTGAEAWYCRNAEFAFQFDTVPAFYFKKVSLACVVRKDSSCIYNTSGRYYPVQQKWIGTGGKVYWDREGLSRDTVYATLADYSFNTRLTYYTADSVTLMHGGYFRKPLTGKLEEKVMSDITPDRAIYPKFAMYPGNRLIIRLFNNIEYEGGFSLEGAKIIGFSSKNSPAKIIVDRNNEPDHKHRCCGFSR